jgi:hypothetical protein
LGERLYREECFAPVWENIWLKVHFHKSMLFGVNVADYWLHEAAVVMNCKHCCLPFFLISPKWNYIHPIYVLDRIFLQKGDKK